MATKLQGLMAIPSCCPPRATAIATEESGAWGPSATIGRLRPESPTTRGTSNFIPAYTRAATTVAAVFPSGLSKINDCARKSAITAHTQYFVSHH